MSYFAVICVLRLGGGIWLNFGGNNVDLGRIEFMRLE